MGARIIENILILFLLTIPMNCTDQFVLINEFKWYGDYSELLSKNEPKDKLLIDWLKEYKGIRRKIFSHVLNFIEQVNKLNNKTLDSFICIEFLSPDGGRPMSLYYLKVGEKVYSLYFYNGQIEDISSRFPLITYEKSLEIISEWKEDLNNVNTQQQYYYVGFLSVYKKELRQYKLTENIYTSKQKIPLLNDLSSDNNLKVLFESI
jgi:hypothetical protein